MFKLPLLHVYRHGQGYLSTWLPEIDYYYSKLQSLPMGGYHDINNYYTEYIILKN